MDAIAEAKKARDLYTELADTVATLPMTFRAKAPLFGIPMISEEVLRGEVEHITRVLVDLGVEEEENAPAPSE